MRRIIRTSSIAAVALATVASLTVAAGTPQALGERPGAAPTTLPAIPTIPGTPTSSAAPTSTTAAPAPTTAVAPTPTTGAAPASTTAAAAAPAAGTVLTDRTGRLTVTVPSTWTDTNVNSNLHDNGSDRPAISASTNRDLVFDDWTVPYVFASAYSGTIDPAPAVDDINYSTRCTENPIEPYTDGTITGAKQVWTACGGGIATITIMIAKPADQSYSILARIHAPSPDDPATAQILDTLAAVPGANPGDIGQPAAPPAGLTAANPAWTAGTTVAGTQITDETGRLTLTLPADWSDVDLDSVENDDLSARPSLLAGPDLGGLSDKWDALGIRAFVFPFQADNFTMLHNLSYSTICTDGGLQTLAVRGMTGFAQTWHSCAGGANRVVSVVVNSPDQTSTVYFEIQLGTSPDDTPLILVLSSIAVTPPR